MQRGKTEDGNSAQRQTEATGWIQRVRFEPEGKPSRSSDGRFLLYLKGEVYNEELHQGRPEQALLEAYVRKGTALFPSLNGQFALILVDDQTQSLTLVSDRTASTSIFYCQQGREFFFSFTLKGLIDLIGKTCKICPEGLASFLACGFFCDGKTLIEGVEVLKPGQMLKLQDGRLQLQQYWNYTFAPERDPRPQQDLSAELFTLMQRAVARRTRDRDRIGILLSGGYDSRAILGCAQRLYPSHSLHTVTWGISESDRQGDAEIARVVAEEAHSHHTFFRLSAEALPEHFRSYVRLSEGRTDAVGNYPESLSIFEQCREQLQLDYLLRGDECFGGGGATSIADALHRLSIHNMKSLDQSFAYLRQPWRRELQAASDDQMDRIIKAGPQANLHDQKDHCCYTQYLFGYLNPLTQLKQKAITVRNPHLDNDVLDFVNRLPTRWRLNKLLFRKTVEQFLPELSQHQFAKSASMIRWDVHLRTDASLQAYVRAVLLQQRNGFDEIISRRPLEDLLQQALAPERLWRKSDLTRVRKRISRWQTRFNLNSSTEIFRLMILKIWADEFLGGEFSLAV